MALQLRFQADTVTSSLPANDNFATSNSILTTHSGPTRDNISDTRNNVRFHVSGFASDGGFETVLFTLRTTATFTFTPQESGRLTTSAHFLPHGFFSLLAQPKEWWEIWLPAGGFARILINGRMDTRVRAANGTDVLPTTASPIRNITDRSITAINTTRTLARTIDTELFQHVIVQPFTTVVRTTDTVRVRARYTVQAIVIDRASFDLDFSFQGVGNQNFDGVNVPLAVLRTDV